MLTKVSCTILGGRCHSPGITVTKIIIVVVVAKTLRKRFWAEVDWIVNIIIISRACVFAHDLSWTSKYKLRIYSSETKKVISGNSSRYVGLTKPYSLLPLLPLISQYIFFHIKTYKRVTCEKYFHCDTLSLVSIG